MEEIIRSLIECMQQEADTYRRMAVLADRQRELLVEGKVSVLPENLRLVEKEVFALNPIIAARKELLARMAKAFHLKNMDLADALERIPVQQAGNFKTALRDLSQSAKKLEEIDKINEKLLGNALTEVKYTLRLIHGARGARNTKGLPVPGMKEESKPAFVNRVI
jgi:dsDNA-binding SOS-regulon protein